MLANLIPSHTSVYFNVSIMVGICNALVHIGTMPYVSGPQILPADSDEICLPSLLLVLDQFPDRGYPLHILGKPPQTHHGQ